MKGDPDKLLYTVPITVLVDNEEVCRCHDIFLAACAMFAFYYMFDICYPAALDNIFLMWPILRSAGSRRLSKGKSMPSNWCNFQSPCQVCNLNGFNLDSDLVQKFLKDYTALANNGKTLFSVGFQVMWESPVIKKRMLLQNRQSPYLSLVWSFLPQACILV